MQQGQVLLQAQQAVQPGLQRLPQVLRWPLLPQRQHPLWRCLAPLKMRHLWLRWTHRSERRQIAP